MSYLVFDSQGFPTLLQGADAPDSAIELSATEFSEIQRAMQEGKQVRPNADGWVIFDAPTPDLTAHRIAELKALLAASDYKVLPDYDKPDEAIVAQRQAWRDEIRELET
jgi:hypothetical protein